MWLLTPGAYDRRVHSKLAINMEGGRRMKKLKIEAQLKWAECLPPFFLILTLE